MVEYLFGSILTVGPDDLALVAGLGVVIIATLALFGRPLLATVLDAEAARVAGLPVDTSNALLSVLTAVTVVASMRVVGVLLVAALMVLPVASSRLLAHSFRTTLIFAVLVGAGSAVVGLGAARVWGLAPGGTIVLTATACFGVVAVLTSRRLDARPWRRSPVGQQTGRTDG